MFKLPSGENKAEHKKLLGVALRYLGCYDKKKFNLDRLEKIEKRVVPNEGERIVPSLKYSFEIEQDEWLEEGREELREEGRTKERKEIARKLLASGSDPKFVAKTTGLTLAEVKKLKAKS